MCWNKPRCLKVKLEKATEPLSGKCPALLKDMIRIENN